MPNKPLPTYKKRVSTPLCNDSCLGWYRITLDNIDTTLLNLCEGTYIIRLTDPDGCPFFDTTSISRNHTLDSLRLWADDTLLWDGESTTLHAATVATTPVAYSWSPAATLDYNDIADPVATPTDTLNIYTLTASSDGCTRSASIAVRCREVVCGPPLFTIPNAFTPNGDGINDALCFNTEQLSEFSISIFNRWGETVYRSDDPTRCWDGTYNGTPCPQGVYTYSCLITCFGNHTNHLKGNITLIR